MSQEIELGALQRLSLEMESLGALISGMEGPAPSSPNAPVEVTILSGFLGAGKTTLLQRVLQIAPSEQVGVIVNDFGAVNLDASLLEESKGGIVRLENGCICCAMSGNFGSALEAMLKQEDAPDRIFVEASGLSDPAAMIIAAERWFGAGSSKVVTVVDAAGFSSLPANAAAALLAQRQIEASHLIVLSKTSNLSRTEVDDVRVKLAAMAPGRVIVDTEQPGLAEKRVLSFGFSGARPTPEEVAHDLSTFSSKTLVSRQPVDITEISTLLDNIPKSVLRLKGKIMLPAQEILDVQVAGTDCRVETQKARGEDTVLVAIHLQDSGADLAQWFERLKACLGASGES